MTFSVRERLIATDIWVPIWMYGSLAFSTWFLFATVDFSLAALRSPLFVVLLVFSIPATWLLTWGLAPLLGYLLFSYVQECQTRRNGGPFDVGDRVVIIPGRNSGRMATVTSIVWAQCYVLKITIDGDDTETAGYSHHQLKRIGE